MKLAIVGSRTFNDYDVLETWAMSIFCMFDCDSRVVISGGAKGADKLSEKFVAECKKFARFSPRIESEIFLPDWNELGKSAGFIRNQQIVDACDMVLAFWDGVSKGTQDTINKAKKAKKPTFIVYF